MFDGTAYMEPDERYDDYDCAEYETADYTAEEEETEDAPGRTARPARRPPRDGDYDFYSTDAKVDRGADARKRYARLAETARTGGPEEKKEAYEEACFYMKGLVRQFISQRYRTYVEKDPDYYDDLESEAYLIIMEELPKYKPDRADPGTFFYYRITHAMSSITNSMKHNISSSDSALKRKILKIRLEYAKRGTKATEGDYVVETGHTLSKIRGILRMMQTDMNTHLEAMAEEGMNVPDSPLSNANFRSPEDEAIRNTTISGILCRLHELFSETECDIFLRNVRDEEPASSIAIRYGGLYTESDVRKLVDRMRFEMQYDQKARDMYYGTNRASYVPAVEFIPLEGQRENMALLATAEL